MLESIALFETDNRRNNIPDRVTGMCQLRQRRWSADITPWPELKWCVYWPWDYTVHSELCCSSVHYTQYTYNDASLILLPDFSIEYTLAYLGYF